MGGTLMIKSRNLKIITTIAILACLATIAGAQTTDWHQFHKDVEHSGLSPSDAPDTSNMLWESVDINAVTASSPVTANGILYVNGGDYVKMIDMYTGEYIGDTDVAGNNELDSWVSPTYYDGRIWCGHTDGVNGGTLVVDGKYYHGNYDKGTYFCYNLSDDTELWNFTVDGYAQGTPAYSENMVYFTSCVYDTRGNIYCVDADTGEQQWTLSFSEEASGTAMISGDTLYFTSYLWGYGASGHLFAIDKNNGTELWNASIERSSACPAFAYGNVYVSGGCLGVSEMKTYCFNASNGSLIWSVNNIGDWKCAVAVADGKVFVGQADGFFTYQGVYALDAFDGSTVWAYGRGGSGPVVTDGIVFTVANNGKVYAYAEDAPDIKPTQLQYPALTWGQANELNATIHNNGNINSGSFEACLLVDGVVEDSQTISSLAKISSTNVLFNWTPPAQGEYELMVRVDTQEDVDERDENNNELTDPVNIIKGPDWNPWNDETSEGGTAITTTELQAAINCWVTSTPAPTGEEVTTTRLQETINDWLNS